MTDLPTTRTDAVDGRPSATTHRSRPAFWRVVRRVAGVCTAGELGTLADHYQVGHPALSARFRAAASVLSAPGHGA